SPAREQSGGTPSIASPSTHSTSDLHCAASRLSTRNVSVSPMRTSGCATLRTCGAPAVSSRSESVASILREYAPREVRSARSVRVAGRVDVRVQPNGYFGAADCDHGDGSHHVQRTGY